MDYQKRTGLFGGVAEGLRALPQMYELGSRARSMPGLSFEEKERIKAKFKKSSRKPDYFRNTETGEYVRGFDEVRKRIKTEEDWKKWRLTGKLPETAYMGFLERGMREHQFTDPELYGQFKESLEEAMKTPKQREEEEREKREKKLEEIRTKIKEFTGVDIARKRKAEKKVTKGEASEEVIKSIVKRLGKRAGWKNMTNEERGLAIEQELKRRGYKVD